MFILICMVVAVAQDCMPAVIAWADPEYSIRGLLFLWVILKQESKSSTYFTEGGRDLPREAIGPMGSNCFSRGGSVPEFFHWVPDPLSTTPLIPPMDDMKLFL